MVCVASVSISVTVAVFTALHKESVTDGLSIIKELLLMEAKTAVSNIGGAQHIEVDSFLIVTQRPSQ